MDLQNFGVSVYLIQVIFGAVDIPAKLIAFFVICYFGRRITQALTLILAGLSIVGNIFVPQGVPQPMCVLRQWSLTLSRLGPHLSPATSNVRFSKVKGRSQVVPRGGVNDGVHGKGMKHTANSLFT